MLELYYKVDGTMVQVYNFYEDGTVLIFSPSLAGRQNGNGWLRVKRKFLIPKEYVNESHFMSKNERNKIKERLTLSTAIWTTTDGLSFEHKDLEKAIEHEKMLMDNEN